MKKILSIFSVVLFIPIIVSAYTSPGRPQGFVSDFANIIDANREQSINNKLTDLEKSTSAEISVVTIPALDDETIETYAVKLVEDWGIGKKEIDNGLLLLIAPNDREVRIEVGYGLEGSVTDLKSNQIIQNILLPAFRSNEYAGGIENAVDALIGIVRDGNDGIVLSDKVARSKINPEALFFIFFVIISVLRHFLSKTKSWWLGGIIGAGIGVIVSIIIGFLYYGLLSIVLLTILGLIFDFLVSKGGPTKGGPGGFWFGPGMGGGSSGGGFGGFGGGFSGGGGASGRW